MKRRLRAALVGCGKVGRTHARALQTLPRSTLVAVCDPMADRAEEFGRDFGAHPYTDLATMLAAESPDMVSICSPHPLHAAAITAAAERGVHALVEKPLAASLSDCDLAIDACRRAGVKLGVVSQRRFYPPVVRMRQAIEAGKIGDPILATLCVLGWRDRAYYESDPWRGTWVAEGGGVMMNQTPHQIDLLQWLMGPVEEVFGYWDNLNHPYIEVEDTAVAVIRFKSGAVGSLVVSNSQNPGLYGRIHVHGSNGASIGAQTESGSAFIAGVSTDVEPPANDVWTVRGEEDLLEAWQTADRLLASDRDVTSYYHEAQIADFLEAIDEDRDPLVTGEDGRKVIEIITAVYRSQRDGKPVKFPVEAEVDRDDLDGRLSYETVSGRGSRQ
jgi:UDP-N-acetyl-2-amino-2-deoxyglucuronate dehydrogenase